MKYNTNVFYPPKIETFRNFCLTFATVFTHFHNSSQSSFLFSSAQTGTHFRALRGSTVDFARIRTFLTLRPRIARMKVPFCAEETGNTPRSYTDHRNRARHAPLGNQVLGVAITKVVEELFVRLKVERPVEVRAHFVEHVYQK